MTARELDGLTAFVTGSGRGLGRVMAERLAELGANVAIHDMDGQRRPNTASSPISARWSSA